MTPEVFQVVVFMLNIYLLWLILLWCGRREMCLAWRIWPLCEGDTGWGTCDTRLVGAIVSRKRRYVQSCNTVGCTTHTDQKIRLASLRFCFSGIIIILISLSNTLVAALHLLVCRLHPPNWLIGLKRFAANVLAYVYVFCATSHPFLAAVSQQRSHGILRGTQRPLE